MSDAVIVKAVRSPGGRYKRGGLAATRGDEFGIQVMKGLLARVPELKPEDVDDVIVGCSFPEAEQGVNLGRIIAMGAGLPITTSGMTINRFCSSGLQAIADATAKIRAGWSEVMIAGGCETMSHIPMGGNTARPNPDWAFDGSMPMVYISMGVTAENVAANYNVSREDMDKFGMESNRRAYEAIKAGKFKEEIVPIQAYKYKVLKNGKRVREKVVFDTDDGVRWPTKLEDMAKLKSPFKQGGNVTAANSSQMTDGAAFCLLMTAGEGKGDRSPADCQTCLLRRSGLQGGRDGRRTGICDPQGPEDGGARDEGYRRVRNQRGICLAGPLFDSDDRDRRPAPGRGYQSQRRRHCPRTSPGMHRRKTDRPAPP